MQLPAAHAYCSTTRQARRSIAGRRVVFQDTNPRARCGWCIRAEDEANGSAPVTTELQDPVSAKLAATPAGSNGSNVDMQQTLQRIGKKRNTKVDSTDAVATFLTRRFGLAGGFAWLGILAAGTIGEQVKTRLEVAAEEGGKKDVLQAKEVELPSGVRYTDMRIGAGALPRKNDLVVVDYMLSVDGKVVEDTTERGRPVVLVFGAHPFNGGVCAGVEQVLASMHAGGRRRVIVPPEWGFPNGTVLRPKEEDPIKAGFIPPGSTLYYDLQLLRVSIAPS